MLRHQIARQKDNPYSVFVILPTYSKIFGSHLLKKLFLSFLTGTTVKSRSMIIRILVFHKRLVTLHRYATYPGRHLSLVLCTVFSGSRGAGSSPGRGYCVVFLDKTLSLSQCLSPPRCINSYWQI